MRAASRNGEEVGPAGSRGGGEGERENAILNAWTTDGRGKWAVRRDVARRDGVVFTKRRLDVVSQLRVLKLQGLHCLVQPAHHEQPYVVSLSDERGWTSVEG